MQYLRQSTASQSVLIGPFVDSTDGVTAETGLTINASDIRLSANGGNMFAKNSGGGTHDEAGWYTITLDATDTATVGRLQLSVAVSGALPVFAEFHVLTQAVYDALFDGSAAGYQVPIWSSASATVNLSATTIATASAVTTVNGLASDVITAASIAAAALNGKGDWNVGKTGYEITTAQFNALVAAIEVELLNDGTGGAVIQTIANAVAALFDSAGADLAPQVIAQAIRAELAVELARIDAATSTRASQASVDDLPDVTDIGVACSDAMTPQTAFIINAINSVLTEVSNLAGKFFGMTSLPMWLRRLFRADAGTGATATSLSTALSEINLDGGAFAQSTKSVEANAVAITAVKAKTDQLNFTIANQVDSNALTGGGGGGGATPGEIADAVLDELLAGHTTAGSLGKAITDLLSAGGSLTPEQAAMIELIAAKVSVLTANSRVSVVSNVSTGGTITLYEGDDYLDATGNAIALPVADVGGTLATELNAAGMDKLRFGAGTPGQVEQITGAILSVVYDNADETTITIEIAKEDILGPESEDYVYQIRKLDDSGRRVKRVAGDLLLLAEHVL